MKTESEWTATPPDKPGWYWWRKGRESRPHAVRVEAIELYPAELILWAGSKPLSKWRCQWWSEPIQEPPA